MRMYTILACRLAGQSRAGRAQASRGCTEQVVSGLPSPAGTGRKLPGPIPSQGATFAFLCMNERVSVLRMKCPDAKPGSTHTRRSSEFGRPNGFGLGCY